MVKNYFEIYRGLLESKKYERVIDLIVINVSGFLYRCFFIKKYFFLRYGMRWSRKVNYLKLVVI